MTRTRWLLINPAGKQVYDQLVAGMNSDQFTSNVSSGFLIDNLRPDSIRARFVEKAEVVDKLTDPFGNETEVKRTQYSQLRFRLQRQTPQIEIYDAPRKINAFVNRLGEFSRGATAIYSPEVSVSAWLRALSQEAESVVVTGALITDLELGESVTAKIALTGERDVRKFIEGIADGKKFLLSQALARVKFNANDITLRIRPECRIAYGTSDEAIESALRKCLQSILQKKNGATAK